MKNKVKRLLAIKKIISNQRISNQEELLKQLADMGFNFTQATLSRDLKFLRVGKVASEDKGYVYVLPESGKIFDDEGGEKALPVNGFVSLDFTSNMAVIRTLPGYANGIAYAIDYLKAYEILGTIAGDDTILVIPREEISRGDLKNILALIIPELNETK